MKEEDNLLNNYGYKYKYNNEIYKYYNKGNKDSTQDKNKEKEKFDYKSIKKIIINNAIKLKWIDF